MKKSGIALLIVLVLGSFSNVLAIDLVGKPIFTVKGGMGIPLRGFADDSELGADIGFGFGGDITHFVSNRIGVGICFDYSFYPLESPEGVDFSLRLFNFSAFSKYVILTNSNAIPYLKLEVGVYQPTLVLKGGGDENSSDYSMKFGFGVGGGIMFKVNDFIWVGGEAMFHDALVKDATIGKRGSETGFDEFGYTLQYIKLNVGITFLIGNR